LWIAGRERKAACGGEGKKQTKRQTTVRHALHRGNYQTPRGKTVAARYSQQGVRVGDHFFLRGCLGISCFPYAEAKVKPHRVLALRLESETAKNEIDSYAMSLALAQKTGGRDTRGKTRGFLYFAGVTHPRGD
jgi:hypothetical protein